MTIPKNTKRAKQVLASARNIRSYSLSDNFSGRPLSEDPVIWGGPVVNNQYTKLVHIGQSDFLAYELRGLHTKLTGESGRYCIHVHDNLWYEFEAA